MTGPTGTETNRESVRRAFQAWQDGTGAITDIFAPDMVWRIEGHSLASREYTTAVAVPAAAGTLTVAPLCCPGHEGADEGASPGRAQSQPTGGRREQ